MHQGTKIIDGPPDDPGGTQGGRGKEKLKLFQEEDHLSHCGTKGGVDVGGIRNILGPMKLGQETNTAGMREVNVDLRYQRTSLKRRHTVGQR